MSKFILIGDGAIARYHRKAIEHVGGKLAYVCDPEYGEFNLWKGVPVAKYNELPELAGKLWDTDREIYVIIASPSHFHREQIKFVLKNFPASTQIICEKPAFLPWEPVIDDDRINICLQLRYLPNLPKKAENVFVQFVRDNNYFNSWKGDPQKTGGIFTNLFIHYILLSIQLKAKFNGIVLLEGTQKRLVDDYDIFNIENQYLYNKLYEDIVFSNNGIKPKDIFLLNWILDRSGFKYGFGKDLIGKNIIINTQSLSL